MKGSRPLTDKEIKLTAATFGGKFGKRDRALFLLGVKSGFRISELLSIRLRDVLQHDRIVDRVTVRRRNMKKKTEGRTVLLHPEAGEALKVWIEELRANGYLRRDSFLFQSRKGGNKPISRIQAYRILEQTYQSNGFSGRLGTHAMRKTFADKVYNKLNKDLVKTQRALGHKNINSTVSYLSFREEEIDQAILAL